MKVLMLSLICLISATAFAQEIPAKDANAIERTMTGSFTAITATDGIDLYLIQGQTESVFVSASDEKYMTRFKTEVSGGTLKLYYDVKGFNFGFNEKRKLKAWVTFKNIDKLQVSGGANVKVDGAIDAGKLSLIFTSGSHFTGKVTAKELNVDQESGSGMTISGKADKIKVQGSSGSIFKGFDLAVDYCEAKASSGAGVHITINKELDAKANSGGGIKYKGDALVKNVNISSGGSVKKEKG
ncbi:MAG TPA: head GIN domain-containing protein [Ferruginibacter sp.]|nr:head GIN domain-containing protein [Ferruginibacter sp.]